GAAHSAAGPAHTLNLMALRWEQLIWQFADAEHQHYLETGRLVHHVVPREINRKVNPVRTQVRQTRTTVKKHGREITTIRRYITTTIERHLKPQIRYIHTTVTRTLPQRIHREEIKRGKLEIRVRTDHKILMK